MCYFRFTWPNELGTKLGNKVYARVEWSFYDNNILVNYCTCITSIGFEIYHQSRAGDFNIYIFRIYINI